MKKLRNESDNIAQNKLPTSNLNLEERLQVVANLIVDRIIEDQANGSLHYKTKANLNYE